MTTIETDILPPESKDAIILAIPERDALPPSLLANIETNFVGFFTEAEKWRQQALSIQITSADQKTEMKLARTIRLALKEVRVTAEKKRVELKKDVNLMAKAIDGANNMLLAAITPLENHLKEQEEFAERLAEEQRQRTIAERHEKLTPYIEPSTHLPPLDGMTEESFASFLADMKTLHDAKIAEAKRIEAERIAREAAAAAEQERLKQEAERLRLENERLEAERAAAEAKAQAEREKAEAEAKAAAAKAKAERDAIEAKAEADRLAAELKLSAERKAAEERAKADREKMQQEAREQAEKERQERAALQDKADAERKAAEAKAKAEREAREKVEKELADQKAKEAAAVAAKLAAEKAAAAAPDKAKLGALADAVRKLPMPELENTVIEDTIIDKIEAFAKWIETQASKL